MRQDDDFKNGKIPAKSLPDQTLPAEELLAEVLQDFDSSPQDVQQLKEVASILCDLPHAQPSSSFQAKLRASLLEKSQSMHGAEQKKNSSGLFAGINKYQKMFFSRPVFTAVASVVMAVVALTAFYSYGLVKPGEPGGTPSWNPLTAMIEQHKLGRQPSKESPPAATGKDTTPVKPPENGQEKTVGVEDGPSTVTPEKTGEGEPVSQDLPPGPGEEELGKEKDSGQPAPFEPEEDLRDALKLQVDPEGVQEEAPLKLAPAFAVEKNMRSIKLAGTIKLPPVYFNTDKGEASEPAPVEKINYAWKPRKTVTSASMRGEEDHYFGTPSWAQEILSNEGFSIREGDLLVTNYQETQKGNFVEIFYSSQKSGEPGPKLILHYEEGKGILGYYFQEQGGIWQPGFYPLLSPSQAFARARGVAWYSSLGRLDFSFQEVFLTYHDFLVEENAQQKTRRLPAYCYLGRETFHNGGELKLYLPAVP